MENKTRDNSTPTPRRDIATGLANEAVMLDAMEHVYDVAFATMQDVKNVTPTQAIAAYEKAIAHIRNVTQLALQSMQPKPIKYSMNIEPMKAVDMRNRHKGMDWSDVQELTGADRD